MLFGDRLKEFSHGPIDDRLIALHAGRQACVMRAY